MRIIKLSVIGLIVIILISPNSVSADSGLSYAVKTGDNQTYKITKDFTLGITKPISFQQTWQDGTKGNITLQEGLIFTITICYVIGSGVNASVYTKATIKGKLSTCSLNYGVFNNIVDLISYGSITELLTPYSLPLVPVTENFSYYQNLSPQNYTVYNVFDNSILSTAFTLEGNNLLQTITGDISRCFSNICDQNSVEKLNVNSEINIDAKTGWYTNLSATESFANGTIYSQFKAIQYSNTSNGIPGFEFSSVLLFVIIVVPCNLFKKKRIKK